MCLFQIRVKSVGGVAYRKAIGLLGNKMEIVDDVFDNIFRKYSECHGHLLWQRDSADIYVRWKPTERVIDTYTAGGLGCVFMGSTCLISHVDRKVVKPIERKTRSGSIS